MDTPTGTTSLNLLEDWMPAFGTHSQRFANVIVKQSKYASEFADALNMYPAGSFELFVIVEKLRQDLINLCEETIDSMDSFETDIKGLKEILVTFRKEKEEKPHDAPQQN